MVRCRWMSGCAQRNEVVQEGNEAGVIVIVWELWGWGRTSLTLLTSRRRVLEGLGEGLVMPCERLEVLPDGGEVGAGARWA
ncbi:MAG: hypothetical protein Q9O62_10295 [Ardenticatenia bacterium]|nr:hypothetical protein [Ardenticatenia bacterium]